MDFSVYIVQDRDITNQDLFDNLAGDVGFFSTDNLANEAVDVASDVVGTEVKDRYADPKLIGKTGIAISGNMINSVSIKKALTKREVYSGGKNANKLTVLNHGIKNILNLWDDIKTQTPPSKNWVTTITVTGNLFAPNLVNNLSDSEKMKNMAKVLAWASLPLPNTPIDTDRGSGNRGNGSQGEALQMDQKIQNGYGDNYVNYYYRRVMVTVYSSEDMQFRAVLHDHVYVASYEEKYTDKDGNGSFTLVMQTKVPYSIYDVIVEGPTYDASFLSVVDTAANVGDQIVDATARTAKTADNIMELDGKLSGPVDKIASMSKNLLHGADEFLHDSAEKITIDNLANRTDDIVDNVRDLEDEIPELKDELHKKNPTISDVIDQVIEYQEEYNKLSDEQKKTLEYIPGFDEMSIDDKLQYVEAELKKDESKNESKA
ncbi:MAG: hypothetical protein IKZ58_00360 [Selenomonadaceae bacterium]|nr:hypothetical protein [Selenomonadaceae bacterium]